MTNFFQLRQQKDQELRDLEGQMNRMRSEMQSTIDKQTITITELTTELTEKKSIIIQLTAELDVRKDAEAQRD